MFSDNIARATSANLSQLDARVVILFSYVEKISQRIIKYL